MTNHDEKDDWVINTFYQAPIDDIRFEIKHIKPPSALKKRESLKRTATYDRRDPIKDKYATDVLSEHVRTCRMARRCREKTNKTMEHSTETIRESRRLQRRWTDAIEDLNDTFREKFGNQKIHSPTRPRTSNFNAITPAKMREFLVYKTKNATTPGWTPKEKSPTKTHDSPTRSF